LDCQEKIVHSSIFNFSKSLKGPWLRTWLLAAGLVVILLVGWESALRALGYRPTVIDDKALWAVQRDRVYTDHGEKALALLGDCRMQMDSVPQVLARRFPGHRVVQLAVEQTSPVATLRDLAADKRFDGVVVCALNARLLCEDLWDAQQPYVDYYHRKYSLNVKLNRLVSTVLQRSLSLFHPSLKLDDLIAHVLETGHLPSLYYVETHADRSLLADFSMVDTAAYQRYMLARDHGLCDNRQLPGPEEWLQRAMQLNEWVRAIQARGGDVVFMQFPTSGEHLEYDEFVFPKKEYWDAFAAKTPALCLHFKDVPELAAFTCPDWSHLDRRDAPRFTRQLANVLEGHGLFHQPSRAVAREGMTNEGSLHTSGDFPRQALAQTVR
jgi:hypothetical protein